MPNRLGNSLLFLMRTKCVPSILLRQPLIVDTASLGKSLSPVSVVSRKAFHKDSLSAISRYENLTIKKNLKV